MWIPMCVHMQSAFKVCIWRTHIRLYTTWCQNPCFHYILLAFLGFAYPLLCLPRIILLGWNCHVMWSLQYLRVYTVSDCFSCLRSLHPQLARSALRLGLCCTACLKLMIDSPAGFHSAPHANAGVRKLRSSTVCRKASQVQWPPYP